MVVTINQFKCSNGHDFEANAKLRTRCPECGVMTRRSFTAAVENIVAAHKDDPPHEEERPKPAVDDKPNAGPVLIRQGRPRMAVKHPAPKPAAKAPPKRGPVGSKVAAGLVKSTTLKKRGVLPTIKRKPVKTAPARGSASLGHEHVKPFWHDVADKYGL